MLDGCRPAKSCCPGEELGVSSVSGNPTSGEGVGKGVARPPRPRVCGLPVTGYKIWFRIGFNHGLIKLRSAKRNMQSA